MMEEIKQLKHIVWRLCDKIDVQNTKINDQNTKISSLETMLRNYMNCPLSKLSLNQLLTNYDASDRVDTVDDCHCTQYNVHTF